MKKNNKLGTNTPTKYYDHESPTTTDRKRRRNSLVVLGGKREFDFVIIGRTLSASKRGL